MTLIGVVIQLIINFKINKSNNELKKQIEKDNRYMANKWNQKKIDADIISKSRMQWINETKKLTSDFMNDSSFLLAITLFCEKSLQYEAYSIKWKGLNEVKKTSKIREELERLDTIMNNIDQQQLNNVTIINNYQENMHRNRLLIKLQFSDNDENNLIVRKVESITNDIRQFTLNIGWSEYANIKEKEELVKKAKELREIEQKEIEELVDVLRKYYKKEWEKVKTGK